MDLDLSKLPWIDEEAIAAQYKSLFHYTKVERLERILRSQTVFGTHYQHTNDANELRALANPFVGIVQREGLALAKARREQGVFSQALDDFALSYFVTTDARVFHDAMANALPAPIYLTCFARHSLANHHQNGLLTLWRFYGGDGEGVALGFDTRKLIGATNRILDSGSFSAAYLDTVSYGEPDGILQQRLAQAPGLSEMFLEYLDSVFLKKSQDVSSRQRELFEFIVLASCSKHPDFIDEREVRLVALSAIDVDPSGRATSRTGDDRHVEFPIIDALDSIMIGPSPDQTRIEERVRCALADAGRSDVRVIRSRTPFVFTRN